MWLRINYSHTLTTGQYFLPMGIGKVTLLKVKNKYLRSISNE